VTPGSPSGKTASQAVAGRPHVGGFEHMEYTDIGRSMSPAVVFPLFYVVNLCEFVKTYGIIIMQECGAMKIHN